MAPEQHLGRKYEGTAVDVFAIGVILFLIYCNHPPFNGATSKDPYYIALASKNYDNFWKKHSENKPNGENFFSPEFKELF
jgi:hypothetical protein